MIFFSLCSIRHRFVVNFYDQATFQLMLNIKWPLCFTSNGIVIKMHASRHGNKMCNKQHLKSILRFYEHAADTRLQLTTRSSESFPLRELLKNKAVVRTTDCTRISRRLNVELIQTPQIGNFVLWQTLCFTFWSSRIIRLKNKMIKLWVPNTRLSYI